MCILQTKTQSNRGHLKLSFEGLVMQRWNKPMDSAQGVD